MSYNYYTHASNRIAYEKHIIIAYQKITLLYKICFISTILLCKTRKYTVYMCKNSMVTTE